MNLEELEFGFNKLYLDLNLTLQMKNLLKLKLENASFLQENTSMKIFFNSKIQSIDISNIGLSGKFKMFNTLINLEELTLRNVNLQSMSQVSLVKFVFLKKLDLSFNNLTEIYFESSFDKLYLLVYLDLSNNQICFIDEKIFSQRDSYSGNTQVV